MSEKSKAVEKKILTELSERFINALESGHEIPWHKPWVMSKHHRTNYSCGLGYIGSSGVEYGLLNSIMLYLAGHEAGEFVTLNELMKRTNTRKEDGSVWNCFIRTDDGKIPKSTMVVYRGMTEYTKKVDGKVVVDENGNEVKGKYFLLRTANVWRIGSQVNCPFKVLGVEKKSKKKNVVNGIAEAEKIATEYISRECVKFTHANENRAYYSPSLDVVNVPPIERFSKVEEYYSTLFHELGHSTGAENRLKRDIRNVFGDHSYSKEELVAELCACILMHDNGFNSETSTNNSIAYIQSWIKSLKSDPTMLEWAFAKAERAVEYIYNG
jgi:antirestriction protein ArdC